MKIGASITWANSLRPADEDTPAIMDWLHAEPEEAPAVHALFTLALEAAVVYLEDRDFCTVSPAPTWIPGVGEYADPAAVTTDLPVPFGVRAGIYEYVRAMRTGRNRAGGDGLGLVNGSAAGVSESYSAASTASLHLLAMQAAIPFWSRYKLPHRLGLAG